MMTDSRLFSCLPAFVALMVFAGVFPAVHGQAAHTSTPASHPVTEEKLDRLPGKTVQGVDLPNGWRISPAGKSLDTTGDLVMQLSLSPDGKIMVGSHAGYLPHGIDVLDTKTQKPIQHIALTSTWVGMAWSSDGHTLYVAGGNASGSHSKADPIAPVYEFRYANGRLSDAPTGKLLESIDGKQVWWAGLAYLPSNHWLYAINRGTGTAPGNVVVFDTKSRQMVAHIPVEMTPYEAVLTKDGKRLFVSNWSSESVSVIDTATNAVISTLHVGMNPNDMKLSVDGRLFVACSNDNTVYVIDSKELRVLERLSTTLTPFAPEGSTPDALVIDDARKLLYIANADNNSIAVAHIENRNHSTVVGFIPTGWYPSALALADHNGTLYIGNTKGEEGHPNPNGPHSPSAVKGIEDSTKSVQTGSIEVLPVADLKTRLLQWTRQVTDNTPYHDSLLAEARRPQEPSMLPQQVGAPTEIKHIIYIIKENRTYDQEFGDLPHTNGDPHLAIFGEKVTPNQHALAKEYVALDNLYCDGEVSVDGHSWSNSAYATDFNEKQWPPLYGDHSNASYNVQADVPSAGHLWDLARKKGLTYRSYGENASRASVGTPMSAAPGSEGLIGHVSPDFGNGLATRDTDKMTVFLHDLKGFEENYDSADAQKRLPNYIVMSLPGDHTQGTTPGAFTPAAMVADNDLAIGQLVDAVSHSRYWAQTAIFIIEDDAQDGADHVDARRTAGLVISPYVKRGVVDSTLYTTSSMIRSIELLLGLPPMSQYDAAAMPMYASFGVKPVMTPFNSVPPMIDVTAKNTKTSVGAKASSKMNFSELDRAPMHALNEIIWKSVMGDDAVMPAPVHRFRPLIDPSEAAEKEDKD